MPSGADTATSDPRTERDRSSLSVTAIESESLARILEMIRAADSKTSFIVGFAAGMLGILAGCLPSNGTMSALDINSFALGAILPFTTLVASALATFPRTRARKDSLLYFDTIAHMSPEQYLERVRRRTPEEHEDDLIAQVHRNAEIASVKYRWVTRAMDLLFLSVAPWLIAVYSLSVA